MKNNKICPACIGMFFFMLLFNFQWLQGQNYGLRFQGQNVKLDKRTELNLTPGDFLKLQGEFELVFDYRAIQPKVLSSKIYFGYIFRLVSESGQNIDLLSTPVPNNGMNLVIGKSNIALPINFTLKELSEWVTIRIKILPKEDRIILYKKDTFYVQENIGLRNQDLYKIIFGANDFGQFKNSDVPSMALKNIKIFENKKLKYFWPLDEESGDIAVDRLKGKEAEVKNPVWLMLGHQNWHSEFAGKFKGRVSIAEDIQTGRLFFLTAERYYIYNTEKNTLSGIPYKNRPVFLKNIFRAVYNKADSMIYCYHLGKQLIFTLDTRTAEWDDTGDSEIYETAYRHHNSYLNTEENILYAFGGYGFHAYKNDIWKIDLEKKNFSKISIQDDSLFQPRYLSGIAEHNDTLYILGGYGSKTGNQLINPHSYFSLTGFSVSNDNLFYKFSIPRIYDDMVVAHKMWICPSTRDYYALVFEKSIFEGALQLIRGNLSSPGVEFVGDKIPFQFLDIRSFAGLYFEPRQNMLYSLASYYSDSDSTFIDISTIDYPPNLSKPETVIFESVFSWIIFPVIAFLLLSGLILYLFYRRRRRAGINAGETKPEEEKSPDLLVFDTEEGDTKYNLILFGGFQAFNTKGEDITNKFSPLLKELLLLILLYTHKNNKGISSARIQEILWPDKSEKSARNNRTVNIAKLRILLNELGGCDISKKTGYWKILVNGSENFCDYLNFMNLVSSMNNLTRQKILNLIHITQKGGFLQNVHYEWLDEFKAQVSDLVVDTLVEYGESCDMKKEADLIIHLSDTIFTFDFMNEEAMILKCRAQYQKGQHSLARESYQKFFKEFKSVYDKEYEKSFFDVVRCN